MNPLRECQRKAIESFEEYFFGEDDNDRGIISMACGAGKTRTCYEIIKKCCQIHEKKIFVIQTPRIDLIYQTYKEFTKWKQLENFDLCIKLVGGSGNQFKEDTIPENTIADTIKSNAVCDNRPILLISTYDSCPNIFNALKGKPDIQPHLIISDEAHNTTGDGPKTNRALIKKADDDENMRFSSEKYLFITATPLKLMLKNNNSSFNNDETVFSMNNQMIYGKIVYEYSFYEAMHDTPPVLVPFNTIYYMKGDTIPQYMKDRLIDMTKEEKQNYYFETISESLITNIAKFNLKHVLVYLQNQTKIKLMETLLNKLMITKNINYGVYKIYSELPKSEQARNRNGFRTETHPTILLSVAMFNEGTDEPCIDSVMFAEDRNSESTIVQNIGRCLRTHKYKNGQEKKKAFVMLPNIIHEFETESTNISMDNTYSSCFKKIREIIAVLHQKHKNDNHFFKKYVKGNKLSNDTDEHEDDMLNDNDIYEYDELGNQIDIVPETDENNTETENENENENETDIVGNRYFNDIIIEEESDEQVNEPDKPPLESFSKYMKLMNTPGDINNETLENIKQNIIIANNLDSVVKYGEYSVGTPYVQLHNEFKSDWICWSHILYNTVFTFNEAKTFIQSTFVNRFETSKDWICYYNELLNNELENKRDISITDDIFNNIIKIPNRPKEFYKGEWIDWNDFLGINDNTNKIVIARTDAQLDTKADKNFLNLLNSDEDKINKFKNNDYNDIVLQTDLTPIKNYIDNMFGFNFILNTRVLTKKNGNYDKISINVNKQNFDKYYVPIVIYPEERKYKYDPIAINTEERMQINRNKEAYIQNNALIQLFEEIITEVKQIVSTSKKNNDKKT